MAVQVDLLTRVRNIHWAVGNQIVVGMPADPGPYFGATPETMSTKNGRDFDTRKFGANTFSGASGLGKTVIGRGYKLIAFGKPRSGPACFIAVDGNWFTGTNNKIQRGVLDERGDLVWTIIGEFPSFSPFGGQEGPCDAYSCTFAGGGFFIVYLVDNEIHMGVSFDGMNFQFGINPFTGVNSKDVCDPDVMLNTPDASPNGGSVAYDKKNKRFVTTGSFNRFYKCHYTVTGFVTSTFETTTFDRNFMSSVSNDGINWTPKFDTSEGYGVDNFPTDPAKDIGHDSAGTSTVCFSDALGLFVATSTYKKNDLNLDNSPTNPSQEFPVFVAAASVATSPDGVNWTNKLIGPESTLIYGKGAAYSFSYCTTFVIIGVVNKVTGSDGFFLIGGVTGNNYPSSIEQLGEHIIWRSEDGVNWAKTRAITTGGFPQAMTQISKTADLTKVVYLA